MPLPLDPRFSPRRRYLLGISGGRDSMALLHSLLDAGAEKIVLCHLNHQLRGLFSSHDAGFVRDQAELHGLPFEIARTNVRRRADEFQQSRQRTKSEMIHRLLFKLVLRILLNVRGCNMKEGRWFPGGQQLSRFGLCYVRTAGAW